MDRTHLNKRFLNTALPVAERVEILVSQMTLREKIAQMLHQAPPIPRLDVPEYNWWNEGLHGVARAGRATVFPQAIGIAATFNVPLMSEVAETISDEARAKHHQALRQGNRGQYFGLTYWSPNINIFRDPRWGRGQETYGECPYLTGRMGVAFVKGLQGSDPKYLKLAATPKHFAVHSGPEAQRHSFNACVSARDLNETYLRAFKECVIEARAAAVMGAYNRTNGEPCCGSHTLLQKILREVWGFDGHVVSDCWAIKDFHEHHKVTATPEESVAMAVKNGCDLNCGDIYPRLLEAVQQGLISEAEITDSVNRLFLTRFRLGMFDPESEVPFAKIPPEVVNCAKHRHLARRVAQESIVLLKNENALLPLRKELKSIAVIGPTAFLPEVMQGNYTGWAPQITTVMEGIIGAVPEGTQVTYAKGCEAAGRAPINEVALHWATLDTELIVAVLGYTPTLEGEEGDAMGDSDTEANGDRMRIGLPGRQLELLQKLHATGKPVVLVLTGGSPIELNWAAENIPAIVMAWYPGEQGGHAVADVLFGKFNPAGRLPVTFIRSLDQIPPFTEYGMAGRTYRFMKDAPLYPFGYGLSYTTFSYSNLELSGKVIGRDQGVTVYVEVQNTGRCDGDEVVQLYVTALESARPAPLRQLEGCRRIHLAAGETKRLRFQLKPEQLATYDDAGNPGVVPGAYAISLGGGQPNDVRSGALTTLLVVQ